MVTIVRLSDKPCFLCASQEDAVEVRFKDRTFIGVVCKEHLFELLKRCVKPAKKHKTDQPARGV